MASDPAPLWVVGLGALIFGAMGYAWLEGSRIPPGTSRRLARILGAVFAGIGVLLGLATVLAALD